MKERYFNLLGKKAVDSVTGFKGVVTSLSFDLYGCIQVVLTPAADKKEGIKDGHWFDVQRIEITDSKPVMALPDFVSGYVSEDKKGAAEKPLP